jgi:hypothetical protein
MEITIHNTDQIVEINGVPARIWEGRTTSGIRLICFITRVAINRADDASEFQRELQECAPPSTEAADFPRRLTL